MDTCTYKIFSHNLQNYFVNFNFPQGSITHAQEIFFFFGNEYIMFNFSQVEGGKKINFRLFAIYVLTCSIINTITSDFQWPYN